MTASPLPPRLGVKMPGLVIGFFAAAILSTAAIGVLVDGRALRRAGARPIIASIILGAMVAGR